VTSDALVVTVAGSGRLTVAEMRLRADSSTVILVEAGARAALVADGSSLHVVIIMRSPAPPERPNVGPGDPTTPQPHSPFHA